ncbi:unnamed protein product [Alopecurus aequalis]
MEFSRRGPATGGAGDDRRRFPDPPAHGEREPMLVMRDALLSQLHMACLRQEIIEADLAKIERAMVLRDATGGHQTPTPMPMPWQGVATTDAKRSQPWPFSAEQPVAQQNAEFDDRELPDSNKDALLSQLHMARLRQGIIEDELAKIERAMALCTATGGHQTLTTPMPILWHGMVTADAGRSKAGPFSAEQPVAQQNANKAIPPSKTSPAAKLEPTGIIIPVKKPKSPMKWSCAVCQVQATCEQNLQQHYIGQKHLSNVATLGVTTKASGQMAKTEAEPSLGIEQKKTSSIKWSCSICKANGTSQSTLETHLKGKRHQQNIVAATCVEGDDNGIPTRVMAKMAEEPSLGTEQKKPSSINWSCSICQANGTSQSTLETHLKGKRHQQNIVAATGVQGDKNDIPKSAVAKTATEPSLGTEQKKTSSIKWSCSTCQANGICQATLEAHLKGKRHQQNIVASTRVERDDNGIPKSVMAKTAAEPSLGTEQKKTSSIKWSCSICQANGTSQSSLETHLKGKRHQQNMVAATGVEGDKNDIPKSTVVKTAAEPSFGTEQKKTSSIKWSCSICQANGASQSTLETHLKGKRHQQNIIAATGVEGHKNDIPKSDVLKTAAEPSLGTEQKKTSSIKWSCSTCQASGICQSTLEAHLKGKRHQQNIVAATSVEGEKNGIPRNVVAQEAESHSVNVPMYSEKPPSAWSCSICQVVCTCQTDLKNHLRGIRHREKVQSLLEQSKNKAIDSESRKSKLKPDSRWMCGDCHALFTCESDAENHLAGHQLDIQVPREKIKQDNNNQPQLAKSKEPTSEWNCAMCEAKCKSRSQFEAHCGSSRHQQKIQAILGNGNIAKGSSSRTISEVPSDGPNSKNASSEKAKQPTLYFCEVCNLLCESSTMLVHHRYGKKHRATLIAGNEPS